MKATYKVSATRSESWWSIRADVPGSIVWSQARRLDQVEDMIREAIALSLNVDPSSFAISLALNLGDELTTQLERTRQVSKAAEAAQAEAALSTRAMARQLRDLGYTVRDCGRLMHLSPQRVSQLLAD